MKVLGLSDLHGNLLEKIPECEVLCICGDTVPLNVQKNMQQSEHWWKNRFVDWCNKQPCKKVIVIAGNHDFIWEEKYKQGVYKDFKNDLFTLSSGKIICLLDESYTYDGIVFYGTPWIEPVPFQEDRWAFSSVKYYEHIPRCDILLTHESPIYNKVLDYHSFGKYNKAHLFGHWHDGRSNLNTKQYNCSRLDYYYRFKKHYKYVIIDVMTESEKKQVEQAFLQKIINQAYDNVLAKWLLRFKEEEPVVPQDKEDEVIWDTSADIPESALITDIN